MSSLVDTTVAQLPDMSTSVISFLAVLGQNTIIYPVILISKNKSIIIRIAAKTLSKSTNQLISLIFLPMRHINRFHIRNTQ